MIGDMKLPSERTFFFHLSRYMFAADMFISPHIWGRVPKHVLKVHVPHGHPVKFACLPKESFEHFDVHFVTGPLHREQTDFTIVHYGIKRTIRICDVGLPKSDRLMNGLYERIPVLQGLGLDPAKKTLIYAPSWEEGLSLRSFGQQLLQQLASLHDINVLIKLHPASCVSRNHPDYDFYTGGKDWLSVVQPYEQCSNIRNVVTDDIGPLLAASDIVLTDISGVALEFLSLLKPVIYIDCPDFFSKTLPSLYKNFGSNTADYIKNDPKSNAGRHVGYVVEKIEELPDAVRFILVNPDFKLNERKAYAKRILYNPGHASEVAADTVLEMLHLVSSEHSESKQAKYK
jgi:CDP-glycerol glycerophosphotransferase (TagB/SpsB family)